MSILYHAKSVCLLILSIPLLTYSQSIDGYFSNPINIVLLPCNSPQEPMCIGSMELLGEKVLIPRDSMIAYMNNRYSRIHNHANAGYPHYVCLKNLTDSAYVSTFCPEITINGMDGWKWSKSLHYRFKENIPDGNYFVWNSSGRLLEHRAIKNNKQNGLMFHSFQIKEHSATINLFEDGQIIKTTELLKGKINGKLIGLDSLNAFEKEIYKYYLNILNVHYFEFAKLQECMPPVYINHFSAKTHNFNVYIREFCMREFNWMPGSKTDMKKVDIQFKIHKSDHPKEGQFYDFKVLTGHSDKVNKLCIGALENYSRGMVACPTTEDVVVKATFMVPNE